MKNSQPIKINRHLFLIVFLQVVLFFLSIDNLSFGQVAPLLMLPGHEESINCLVYSPDGKQLVSGSKDGKVKIWDVAHSYTEIKTLAVSREAISGLSFSHDGTMIAIGTYKKLLILNAISLKKISTIKKAHTTFVKAVHFTSDDNFLVSSSWKENSLMMWSVEKGKLKKVRKFAESNWTDDADFTTDGKYIVSVNHDNTAKQWDVQTGNVVRTFAGHTDWIYALKITSDQKLLITASIDNTLHLWDMNSGRLLNTLEGHTEGVTGLSLSIDNRYIASCGLDSTVLIWELGKTIPIARFKASSAILAVEFSPDRMHVASAGNDRIISIWDIRPYLKKD